ncbi:MAG: hypothetical protein VB100_05075 [Angelakisella sp.]|nr:hypothetical protein [Angelakisella sp.]
MNFFEQELKKILLNNHSFHDIKFIGKTCYGTLSDQTRMKLEFVTMGTHQKYEGIKATVIDKNEGVIDAVTLRFSDVWGKKPFSGATYKEGLSPHVWIYQEKVEWYGYEPSKMDYTILGDSLKDYCELYVQELIDHSLIQTGNQQM